MTTQHEMAMAYIDQQKVIDVLRSIDDLALVDRLEQCMTAHRNGIMAVVGLARAELWRASGVVDR